MKHNKGVKLIITYHVIIWAFIFADVQKNKDISFETLNEAKEYFEKLRENPTTLQEDIFEDGWFGYSHDMDDDSEIDEGKYNLVAEMGVTVSLIKSEKCLIPGVDFKYESRDGLWFSGSISSGVLSPDNLIELYVKAGAVELDDFDKGYMVGWPQELC